MHKLKWLFAFITILPCTTMASWLPQSSTFYGDVGYAFSPFDGYIQLPLGGMLYTSSPERPRFDELSIDHATLYEAGFSVDWPALGIYGTYQNDRPNGEGILPSTLVTYGHTIPAGTLTDTETSFDLYSLGVDHKFYFLDDRLAIYPEAEYTALDFNYNLSVPGAPAMGVQRGFVPSTARLGLGAEYRVNKVMSLSVNGLSSIPGTTNLQVQTVEGDANFKVIDHPHISTSLFAGVGYERIDFEDHASMPNHIDMQMAPLVRVGIKINFR